MLLNLLLTGGMFHFSKCVF